MKTAKFIAALLALIMGLTLSAAPLAEDNYGALRLQEEKSYRLREVIRAMLEETSLRLQWLSQAAERFPEEPLLTQALEMEQARAQAMLQQFAAWGFSEQTIQPPGFPEVPVGHEQALKTLRDMAQRGMLMSMRLEANREVPDEDRFQAHMWGHEYRRQLDDCDLKANAFGYAWAWQYDGEEPQQKQNQEQNQEQNQMINGFQGETEPSHEQNNEQNQEVNGPQADTKPAQELNQEQNQEMNRSQDDSEPNQEQNQEQNQESNGAQEDTKPAQEQNQEQNQKHNGTSDQGVQNQQENGMDNFLGGKGK